MSDRLRLIHYLGLLTFVCIGSAAEVWWVWYVLLAYILIKIVVKLVNKRIDERTIDSSDFSPRIPTSQSQSNTNHVTIKKETKAPKIQPQNNHSEQPIPETVLSPSEEVPIVVIPRHCETDMVVADMVAQEIEEQEAIKEIDWLYRISHTYKRDAEAIRDYLDDHGVEYFYHFTDTRNIDSIHEKGGLFSWHYCESHHIEINNPGGSTTSRSLDVRYGLEDYVRLSFCDDHPMIYRLKQQGYDIVVFRVKAEVALLEGTLFSDINATDSSHHHGGTLNDLKRVNIEATKENYVSRNSPIFKQHQAEVLVRTFIPIEYIDW